MRHRDLGSVRGGQSEICVRARGQRSGAQLFGHLDGGARVAFGSGRIPAEHAHRGELSEHLAAQHSATSRDLPSPASPPTSTVCTAGYERFHDASMFAPKPKGTVPTGVAVFKDGDYAIRRFAEKAHTITHWSEFYSGGHFPALEVPELLVGDVREFFRTLGD
ncbi:hypothetical protein AB4305_07765 [Nocardia sp. 2YAB30]|uniref:hypothetical protein n=1 Tax=unclassified Nocardia TaxID=2637762 RepID=UPI003F9444EA